MIELKQHTVLIEARSLMEGDELKGPTGVREIKIWARDKVQAEEVAGKFLFIRPEETPVEIIMPGKMLPNP